ncbi:hypothetical protein [Xanthomonas sp. 10-10]|uniref:Uncharacterized protein n=1 Tax=Xanthomonas sp. 10-10 TaxID=3115848 RepID=A0AAU7PDF6_9XANT
MKKAPRSEAEVFAELADLASSEGYVHAVALICCRDNLIPYVDDLKASDLQKLYRRDRLIRTEITTLLGLLARRTIDAALPTSEVMQEYVARTDALMEELHVAIGSPMFDLMKAAMKSEIGMLTSGAERRCASRSSMGANRLSSSSIAISRWRSTEETILG